MNAFRGCTVNKKKKDYRLLGRIPAASFLAFTYLHSEPNAGMSVLVNFLLSSFFLIFFFSSICLLATSLFNPLKEEN